MKKLIILAVAALFTLAVVCPTASIARTTPQSSQAEYQQSVVQTQQMFAQDEGDTPKKGKKIKKAEKQEGKKPVKKAAKKAKKDED